MIATNYRKHPEALALQLPLPFGHALKWATARPGSRILRAIRAARAAAFKAAGRIRYPEPATLPDWCKQTAKAGRDLAKTVRTSCRPLFTEEKGFVNSRKDRRGPPRWALIGFNYAE